MDARGAPGLIEIASSPEGENVMYVRLPSGDRRLLPSENVHEQVGGAYLFSGDFDSLDQEERLRKKEDSAPVVVEEEIIPLAEERLRIHRRTVETGRVRIEKKVHTRSETVDEPLLRQDVEIEHVPVGQVIDGPVSIRQEGETTIIPVVEERLVIRKELVLKEEIRITPRRSETREPQQVALRSEEVVVVRNKFLTEPEEAADDESLPFEGSPTT